MRRATISLFAAFSLVVGGCAQTSGVIPSGKDTYLVSRSHKGFDITGSMEKAAALKEADNFCSAKHKSLDVIRATAKDMVPFTSDAQAEVEFRCVERK
jgi:hypothetical protein